MTFLFRLFLFANIAALLVALYFFVTGLGDGTVSSFNIVLWLTILAGLIAAPLCGVILKTRGYRGIAVLVLAMVAVPAILAAIAILLMIVLNPRWN
ncbi:MAG: osmoprotectant transporter permease [Pseudomonadota bacterium]